MNLTSLQQSMLDGKSGEAVQQSMEILVALGKIYSANGMVPVSSAQIAGVSYKTIGEAGLDYLSDLVRNGAKVRIPTFLNPAGMDRDQWQKMGVPEEFAKKQILVLDAFSKMGITMSCTCTPYHIGIRPKVGEHVAWAESSAVSFCNSVLGARTNREGGPSALAAAICGFTPNYGYHLDEKRTCGLLIEVKTPLKTNADFGALGAWAGPLAKNRNPAFTGISKSVSGQLEDKLKALGAGMAASGSVALFNAKGITPEWNVGGDAEKVSFGSDELKATRRSLDSADSPPQLIAIGCPHASLDEIKEVAAKVKGKKLAHMLWVCTARETKKKADTAGFTATIEKAGGLVVADTCMVVCPLKESGFTCTATNSGKAGKYLASLQGQKVAYGDVDDIITR
ncbi:MAG: aconitase X catalytic domain-containing protein [Candidatus Micrarchaeota archaeon]